MEQKISLIESIQQSILIRESLKLIKLIEKTQKDPDQILLANSHFESYMRRSVEFKAKLSEALLNNASNLVIP